MTDQERIAELEAKLESANDRIADLQAALVDHREVIADLSTRKPAEGITARELREIIFHVTDQDMTVKQLRTMLFDAHNIDALLPIRFGMFAEMEAYLEDQRRHEARLRAMRE